MKLFKIFSAFFVVALFIIVMPTGCSKTGYTLTSTTVDSATQIVIASDELDVNYEFDQVINEALLATTISKIASGDSVNSPNGGLYNTISNVSIDTSHITDSMLIRLTYAGKNTDQTKGRSGSVTLQYGLDNNGKIIQWKTPGASITAAFNQYEVITLSNNKSVWMNGTVTITNVSGGLLKAASNINLSAGNSLHDKVNGPITFTYNDNTTLIVTWTWNLNQQRTFTMQNSLLTSSITGDTTISNVGQVSTSGLTRFNDNFYTAVITPVVQTISPAFVLSNPISGEKVIHGIPEPLDVVYGVNNTGAITTGVPYGYKITWALNGSQEQSVISY